MNVEWELSVNVYGDGWQSVQNSLTLGVTDSITASAPVIQAALDNSSISSPEPQTGSGLPGNTDNKFQLDTNPATPGASLKLNSTWIFHLYLAL